ncbi:MAG: male sterility protein-domain-containing protein [Monoraphidium minutum]|nr:MAG: male sterility protein-domain-containing protein [Monoraphidium minutum]
MADMRDATLAPGCEGCCESLDCEGWCATAPARDAHTPRAPAPAPKTADHCLYSIRGHFGASCCVLLTGATGYIGSLVLEKLLRSTAVGTVYVLLRPRRGAGAADRLAALLGGPLFHLLDPADAAARVVAVQGDMLAPGLGLSPEDEAELAARVDTVIHSAADIRLDAHIHKTLAANFLGTRAVLALAGRMPRLTSLLYLATCYVNINRPRGSDVEERLYSLQKDGREVDAAAIAEELLALPPDAAAARAAELIELWGFRNTYALGKHLAEKDAAAAAAAARLPLAVVRPALVSAVAAEPYIGYAGNFAGPVGAAAAYVVGLYDDQPEATAMAGSNVWDVIPGDCVAATVIAAAAAAAAPAARGCIAAAGGGPADEARRVQGAGEAAGGGGGGAPPLMLVHASSSCTYPLTGSLIHLEFDADRWARHMKSAERRVAAAAHLGSAKLRAAERMLRVGLATFKTVNAPKYDLDLYFRADNLAALEEALAPEERADFVLVWRPPPPAPPAAAAPRVVGAPAASPPRGAAVACGCFAAPQVCDGASDAHSDTHSETHADGAEIVLRGAPPAPKPAAAAAGAGGASKHAAADWRARAAAARAGGWVLFHHNIMAFMYSQMFRRQVAPEALLPRRALRALAPLMSDAQRAKCALVRHTFVPVAARRGGEGRA